eukprot:scaffold1352_cov261-Pinguiococcus_pyrenoidosus.AAC.11
MHHLWTSVGAAVGAWAGGPMHLASCSRLSAADPVGGPALAGSDGLARSSFLNFPPQVICWHSVADCLERRPSGQQQAANMKRAARIQEGLGKKVEPSRVERFPLREGILAKS